jgi:hypothetical protein
MNLPARQELQEVRSAEENLPPGQAVQVAAVLAPEAVLYLPTLQIVQLCVAHGE